MIIPRVQTVQAATALSKLILNFKKVMTSSPQLQAHAHKNNSYYL